MVTKEEKEGRIRLGEQLKRLREAKGLKRREVGEHMECDSTNIAHIEAGRQGVTVGMLHGLARLYDVAPGLLLDTLYSTPTVRGRRRRA